jgi:uncharacterized protein YaeQ
MALTATVHRFEIVLSDVDRGVYETLDLRVARHPSESLRYLVTRVLAYCLSYEEGIAFSKGGVSSTDEPPVAVFDATGVMRAWIDVGSPSAERLHKAAKMADRVSLYTHADLALLRKEAATRAIHRVQSIEVWRFEPAVLDAIAAVVDRTTIFEVVRNDGHVYVTLGANTLDVPLAPVRLVAGE